MSTMREIASRAARRLRRRGLHLTLLAVGMVVVRAEACSKEDFYDPLGSLGNGGQDFTVSLTDLTWEHDMPGESSLECKVVSTNPARPGATFSVTTTGPTEGGASGVVTAQPVTGVLDANGRATIRVRINRFGTYSNAISVTSGLITRTATANVTVTGAANECP